MYDIRQFKPALYVVLLTGLTGYGLASESPGLWVFAVSLILTNVWMIKQGAFRPIPRIVANVVTLLAFVYAFLQVHSRGVDSPILAIGQFLVLLQVVKVWEQRANRDYAQLLILSLLLMVAAAISTASLAFGLIFVGYLLASLYCCLLFHLKVETDEARAAQLTAVATPPVADGRPAYPGDRGLPASMRRLTGLVAAYAMVTAVVVFLFFPRGAGAGLFGQYVWKPRQTLTGFSEQVSFQQVAKITQNNDQVGTIKVTKDGKPALFAGPLMLRGYTDDYYSGNDNTDDHGKFTWSHSADGTRGGPMADRENGSLAPQGSTVDDATATAGALHQEIELSPTGTPVLFALAGLTRVRIDDLSRNKVHLDYNDADETIRASDELTAPIRYSVDSTGDLGNEPPPPATRSSVIDPAIRTFAVRPELTGGLGRQRMDEAAARADKGAGYVSPLDEQIAARIEAYLRRNYAYTLDLTTVQMHGRDPMAAFLTDFKKGHCEYFAGAMTLLCQSLGMQARYVVGFKVDEVNLYGHFYTIRQSHAHAWVEVRTTRGWQTFDPTSGREAGPEAASVWQRTKSLFDFMEYTWQRAVISYSSDSRDNLINTVDAKLTQQTYRGATWMYRFRDRATAFSDWAATHVVGPMVVLVAGVLVGAAGWYAVRRVQLRRRAARIGLDDLPADAQARLVRQLAFYDDLVRLLARHRIARPPHLTPLEFSRSLAFLPANAYDTIARLTAIFYRIRFGGADLDDGRQRRLLTMVQRLDAMMPTAGVD
jgi:transglutaminase-like putative cysteine protease